MNKILLFSLFALASAGCAVNAVYDPLQAASEQTFVLNESALAQVQKGMTQEQAHDILGQAITIGYAYQNLFPQDNPRLTDHKTTTNEQYKPLTLNNPYKQAKIQSPKGECTVEYYVTSIKQPDGQVTDDELSPLVFCGGILTTKGWSEFKKNFPESNP